MKRKTNSTDIIRKVSSEFRGRYSEALIKDIVTDFFSIKGIRYFTMFKYNINIKHLGRLYWIGSRRKWARKVLFGKNSKKLF